ncbi:winged helix-turn-helix transcriptional regulator (plasmid) [Halococcus dombrowskii]|nr:winged helix-turn-helix transcriptional regulator [Halococcus dombrowskii]UOO97035.1 winged helix-turn-helix transcriptional regulator [Halococcus dombrowskii]
MNTSFAAFFERKGAVELLCIADRRDFQGRFTDLDDEINVSHSTLSKRLSEAQELGLITVAINPEASSPETVYRTTQTGKQIQNEMRKLGLPRTYERLRTVEELFAEGSEELVEWTESLDAALAEKAEEYSKQVEDPDVNMNPDVEFSPLDSQVKSAVFDDLESIER